MIYVHVPFCRSFCTYCDFYSEIACRGKDAKSIRDYAECLKREIRARRSEIDDTSRVRTLYIGGGTPSVLPLSVLEDIVRTLDCGPFDEFTVEVNPEDIADGGVTYAEGLKTLGVSRVSMGVQSLDDGILRWMNRRHDAATAARAFGILRDGGIDNISVDVIFGLSQLSEKCLEDTLNGILSWHPDHISAYQLSIEEGSALAEMTARGRYREADEELCGRQYSLICGTLAQAGMRHYEISNWAVPGREAVHNGAYWTRAPYVGLGPGAHSLTAMRDGTQMRSWNSESPEGWMSEGETLTAEDILTEEIMLGLRTDRGVKAGIIDADIAGEMLRNGCLERAGDNLRIPEDKFFVSDDIIGSIVAAY